MGVSILNLQKIPSHVIGSNTNFLLCPLQDSEGSNQLCAIEGAHSNVEGKPMSERAVST